MQKAFYDSTKAHFALIRVIERDTSSLGDVAGDLSTALPVQSCGIVGGEFRKRTLGARFVKDPN